MASNSEPKKFSTRSALAFVLPAEHRTNVEAIRQQHDKAYARWPPHINFLFPFIFEEDVAAQLPRLRAALAHVAPFTAVLDTVGSFSHGKGSYTVWLGPQDTQPFEAIFRSVAPLFPQLGSAAREQFVPHMTLGQCRSAAAVAAATDEFKRLVGTVTCRVDAVQVLVRDADTRFEPLYTIYLGDAAREPLRHVITSRLAAAAAAGSASEDAALEAAAANGGADPSAAAAEAPPSIAVLLNNHQKEGPQTVAELFGVEAAPEPAEAAEPAAPLVFEKPLVSFFDNSPETAVSAVALDTSGSTAGSLLRWSVQAVRDAVEKAGAAAAGRAAVLERAISWNSVATVLPLARMSAGGMTVPQRLFGVLPPTVRNLLMTTDGLIDRQEVRAMGAAVAASGVRNVVAMVVGSASTLAHAPKRIDVSVFFPLMEHCARVGGTFLLFFVTKRAGTADGRDPLLRKPRYAADAGVSEAVDGWLLVKRQTPRCAELTPLPTPPADYTDVATWDAVPRVNLSVLADLLVDADGDPRAACEDGAGAGVGAGGAAARPDETHVDVAGAAAPVDLVAMVARVQALRGAAAARVLLSPGMDAFVCDVLPGLLAAGRVWSPGLVRGLRAVVSKWSQLHTARIRSETRDARCDALCAQFRALSEQRLAAGGSGDTPALREELARVADELGPLAERVAHRRQHLQHVVDSVASGALQALAELDTGARGAPLGDADELPEAFTLDTVVRHMANRVRRAAVVAPAKLAVAADAQGAWDLAGAPPVCDECLICARGGVPAALLAVDVAQTSTRVLAHNVSDVGLDDALATGLWNTVAFPAGTFCVQCAFSCAALGTHPVTRQPVAAVLPCVDLARPGNRTLFEHSLCSVFYGGKALGATAWLVFLGALDGLAREQRFPGAMLDAFAAGVLHHARANLFPESSPLARTQRVLDAMRAVVAAPVNRLLPDSWLDPLRNRSVPSIALIARTVVAHAHDGDGDGNGNGNGNGDSDGDGAAAAAAALVRRQLFKTFVTAVLAAAKRSPANLAKMRAAIESDLYDAPAACPVAGTERLVALAASNTLRAVLTPAAHARLLDELARTAHALGLAGAGADSLVSPAAYSAFLAYVYEHVTRAPPSASQRKVEAFLADCLAGARSPLVADAFFEGSVRAAGGDPAAVAAGAAAAPYAPGRAAHRHAAACGHTVIPQFAPEHLFSPPVSHCASCGCCFLAPPTVQRLRTAAAHGAGALASAAAAAADELRAARGRHFHDVYNNEHYDAVPTACSATIRVHESVRLACAEPRFAALTAPTRDLVLAVLRRVLAHSTPGFPYVPDLLAKIAVCANDFLQKRAAAAAAGRPVAPPELMLICDRLALEAAADDLAGVAIATADSIPPALMAELTAPLHFNAAAANVAVMSDDDDADGDGDAAGGHISNNNHPV